MFVTNKTHISFVLIKGIYNQTRTLNNWPLIVKFTIKPLLINNTSLCQWSRFEPHENTLYSLIYEPPAPIIYLEASVVSLLNSTMFFEIRNHPNTQPLMSLVLHQYFYSWTHISFFYFTPHARVLSFDSLFFVCLLIFGGHTQ